MKKLMILGASILQLPAIEQAKRMGLQVIAVDRDPEAIGFGVEGVIREVISTNDIPSVLASAKKHKIDGIMTLASDMPMRTIAKVSTELGLAGISEKTAYRATDKAAMRKTLEKAGVPIPVYYKVSNEQEFFEAVQNLRKQGYKVIVKPADNSGSRGVEFISNYTNEKLQEVYKYSKNLSRSGDIVVEEYMEGPEVSVETLTIKGECNIIQITDKLTTGAPYFVEMGHSQPSQLDEMIQKKIKEVTIAANRAIGITNGPSHTEIKVTDSGPKIVEIGARLGGDNIATHLVPLSTGIDMIEKCIFIALNKKVELTIKKHEASAIRYFTAKKGIIKKITGIEEAKNVEGIRQVSIVHGMGERVTTIRSSIDRIGFVISEAKTAELAIGNCQNAISKIEIETS